MAGIVIAVITAVATVAGIVLGAPKYTVITIDVSANPEYRIPLLNFDCEEKVSVVSESQTMWIFSPPKTHEVAIRNNSFGVHRLKTFIDLISYNTFSFYHQVLIEDNATGTVYLNRTITITDPYDKIFTTFLSQEEAPVGALLKITVSTDFSITYACHGSTLVFSKHLTNTTTITVQTQGAEMELNSASFSS